MKKLTAALSAAAIAVTMAVPFTASAATEDFEFNFDSVYTQGDAWAVVGGTGTNQEKIESARNTTTGKLAIQKDAATSTTPYQIQKSSMGLTGAYTISFDLTIPTAGNVNQFVCELKDSKDKTIIYKTNYFYSSTKSEALVKYNLSGVVDNPLTYTDNSGNVRLKGETEYTVTISMGADGGYSITTVPVSGSDFFNKNKTANTITGSFNDYVSTENIRFYCADVSAAPYYIDNIKLVTEKVDPVKATAETTAVQAEWAESVTIEGITITGTGTIQCGEKNVQFYRTDITAGDTDVNGGTIIANDSTPVAFETKVLEGAKGSFYTAVTYTGELPEIKWTVTCNE